MRLTLQLEAASMVLNLVSLQFRRKGSMSGRKTSGHSMTMRAVSMLGLGHCPELCIEVSTIKKCNAIFG